jgi:hypothetical protein
MDVFEGLSRAHRRQKRLANDRLGQSRDPVRFAPTIGHRASQTSGPKSADSVAKVFLSHRSQIFRAVGAAIEYWCETTSSCG